MVREEEEGRMWGGGEGEVEGEEGKEEVGEGDHEGEGETNRKRGHRDSRTQ